MRSLVLLSMLSLLALSGACAEITADASSEATGGNGSTGSRSGDDAIQNQDGAAAPSPPTSEGGARWVGSPLCGDPSEICLPDDPRRSPGCGNEANPEQEPGSDPGGAPEPNPDEEPGDPDDGDPGMGQGGRARACRVQVRRGGERQNACKSAGSKGEGESCTSRDECGASLDCVREHHDDRVGSCRAYCCEGSCGEGADGKPRFCDAVLLSDVQARIPSCMPVHPCALLGTDQCAVDETCAIVRESDGTVGCIEIGIAGVGEACDVEHCAAGLTCLGQIGARTCFQLCSVEAVGCPAGQECTWAPPTFNEAGIGVCIDSATTSGMYQR